MTLRDIATEDLNAIITQDFGIPIVVIDPAGTRGEVVGYTNDIGQIIDPDTGQMISGRLVSVAISLRSLTAVGLGVPQGIEKASLKPWYVTYQDTDFNQYTFKIMTSNPDRTLGIVTCELELYNA